MRKILIAAALSLTALVPAQAASGGEPLPHVDFSFDGVFGTFDRNQLQRGFQVYKEVCAQCHGLSLVAFRNLHDPGGPEFSEAEARALAAGYEFPALDDTGQPITRKGTLADYFPTPWPNPTAAAYTYGAVPPDLSLIAKGRENGPVYIHALMTGYEEPPAGFVKPDTAAYNKYFPGHVIAMPAPLTDGAVEYAEADVPRTVDQYAKDVAAFLMWTAEPKMEVRKRTGFGVIIFLTALATLFFFSYRRVWRNVDH